LEQRLMKTWLSPLGLMLMVMLNACALQPTRTPVPVAVTVYGPGTDAPTTKSTAVTTTPAPLMPTSTPVPGATAIPVYGPDSFPDNISPLTGETVDPAKLNRLPVAIKISNYPYAVRPQSGLALADVVFEHSAEAGLTRFTAVFLQNDVAKVGSIRSARFIDAEIAPMFDAVLVTSGSSLGTMEHLRTNPWFAGENRWRLVSEESNYVCPPLCRETPDDTNTLFTNTEAVRTSTAAQGSGVRANLTGWAFTTQTPIGTPVSEVLIDYSLAAHVSWRYNADTGRYMRWQEKDSTGELAPHLDAVTSAPITAFNVVLLQANQVNNFVPEDFRDGGNCGVEIQLWTIGPAKIFRDGVMIDARWHRDDTTNWRLRLEDPATGQVIPLKPGNTWFAMVGLNAITTLNNTTFSATHKVVDTKYGCPIPATETPTLTPEGYVAPTETPVP
jgi:hypothetical protein